MAMGERKLHSDSRAPVFAPTPTSGRPDLPPMATARTRHHR